jgi:Protein kinase domain/Concanavalin A-like lectin/glucanases superfamily/Domain of Unknown Function (DUF1080)
MAGIDEPQGGNSPFALNAGQRVGAGRFRLMRQLGRGGMGVVWLAFDERLQEAVALKFLPPEVAADAMALDDLRRETRKSRRLTHPNIIRIHDLYEAPDEPAFISMEYVEGSNLTALRLENEQRCFTWAVVAPLALQLCQALEYAHGEKVVHRDLKPANVMLDGDGRLKLADFGIAGTISDSASRISARFSTSGTLAYMSPQQMNGERPSVKDDIYSLGATLYELLTSRPPFNGGDIPYQVRNVAPTPMTERLAEFEITNAIPGSASALIMACLAKEAAQRPQSARAVMERIQSSYEGDVSPAGLAQAVAAAEAQEAYNPEEAAQAEGSRGWLVWTAALVAVVLAIGGAAWYFAGHRADSQEVQKKPVPEQKTDTGQSLDGATGESATTAHAPPIRDGLVLYFNFDEPPKNGVVPDESGSGNAGHVVNAQWTTQGRHGGAMQFSRSNSYITVPNRPSLNPAQITVAAWVKTSYSDNVWRRIFDKAYAKGFALSEGGDYQSYHNQGQLVWEADKHDVESRQHRLDDGWWHHVAGTYDGTVQALYLDGQLLTMERIWSGGISANNYDLTIGANHSTLDNNDEFNASFDGLIDEVMMFNRALSSDEIRQLYDAAPAQTHRMERSEVQKKTAQEQKTGPVQTSEGFAPPEQFVSLFNGRDLTGWSADPNVWSVKDGVIYAEELAGQNMGSGIKWANGTVANFVLRLKVRFKDYFSKRQGNIQVNYRAQTNWMYAYTFSGITNEAGSVLEVHRSPVVLAKCGLQEVSPNNAPRNLPQLVRQIKSPEAVAKSFPGLERNHDRRPRQPHSAFSEWATRCGLARRE